MPGGPSGAIQFNDSGSFGGSVSYSFDDVTQTVTLGAPGLPGIYRTPAGVGGPGIDFHILAGNGDTGAKGGDVVVSTGSSDTQTGAFQVLAGLINFRVNPFGNGLPIVDFEANAAFGFGTNWFNTSNSPFASADWNLLNDATRGIDITNTSSTYGNVLFSDGPTGEQSAMRISTPFFAAGLKVGADFEMSYSISATNTFTTHKAVARIGYQLEVPADGFSIQISSTVPALILAPAGPLLAGEIVLPDTPEDGMILKVGATDTIAALAVTASAGQSVTGAPSAIDASSPFTVLWVESLATWVRV